ncbi:CHAT domain-containing protein [Cellulomonas sp. KRMCY2]|uniref:CHAT domain-containing protein n=1 Tax=Cellulomonas sp. KRMCY2 TaxID=1304865 RepID=UPI00045E7DF0|nr:CHAT domain-containing protein [Cellulomonas sp. KRMCY2]
MIAVGGLEAARQELDAGLVHNARGYPGRAASSFRAALRRLGPEPGSGDPADPETAYVRARALLGLVTSSFELRGDVEASNAILDTADRWARAAGARAVEVAILGQRGLLRMRAGQPEAALRELDRAAARLDDAEPVDACRILLNRGTLHLEHGRRLKARADLEACARRAESIGNHLLLHKARHNLGYLEFLSGDLPAALSAMAEAARIEHGASPAMTLLDRARVLVEAGLTTEADISLGRAGELFAANRLPHDLAEVLLARAHCALLARRPKDALRWARSARSTFLRRRNQPWLARADLTVVRAQLAVLLAAEAPSTATLRRVAAQATALSARARTSGGAAGRELARLALVTAAEAAAAGGLRRQAHAALGSAGRLTGREPLALAVQVRLVKAQLAFAEHDTLRARRYVRAGQAVLAEHRRQLGSVEAVAAAAVHGDHLTEADVGAALADADPAAVLDAVERGRATFAGPARVRPPDDPVLAEVLAELRQCVERVRLLPPDADPTATAKRESLRRDAARLRAAARERSWQLGDGVGAPRAMSAHDLVATVRSGAAEGDPATVVDYVVHRGRVHAVVADPSGLRLLNLADAAEVDELARRLRADLQVLANPILAPALRDVASRTLARGLAHLDNLLLAPVGCAGCLHVVAGGGMVTLPWGMAPSRKGLATSVGTRLGSGSGHERRAGVGVVAVAGPGLTHSQDEVAAVAGVWSRAASLVGDDAVCAAAADALRTAGVVHLAVHGHHEAENPLFSWVRLADGPLFAHELEGSSLPGSLVVLSACEVGRATVRPGGEVLGLASVLLRLGAGAVVAALAPLRDDVAEAVMPTMHRSLRDGLPPPAALAAACSSIDEPVPLSCFASAPGVILDGALFGGDPPR